MATHFGIIFDFLLITFSMYKRNKIRIVIRRISHFDTQLHTSRFNPLPSSTYSEIGV